MPGWFLSDSLVILQWCIIWVVHRTQMTPVMHHLSGGINQMTPKMIPQVIPHWITTTGDQWGITTDESPLLVTSEESPLTNHHCSWPVRNHHWRINTTGDQWGITSEESLLTNHYWLWPVRNHHWGIFTHRSVRVDFDRLLVRNASRELFSTWT